MSSYEIISDLNGVVREEKRNLMIGGKTEKDIK